MPYWPEAKLVVEADSWTFHHHRGAFEHDRARDAAMQAAGHRVIRVTYRRLEREPDKVAAELRSVLSATRPSASTSEGDEGPDGGRAAT